MKALRLPSFVQSQLPRLFLEALASLPAESAAFWVRRWSVRGDLVAPDAEAFEDAYRRAFGDRGPLRDLMPYEGQYRGRCNLAPAAFSALVSWAVAHLSHVTAKLCEAGFPPLSVRLTPEGSGPGVAGNRRGPGGNRRGPGGGPATMTRARPIAGLCGPRRLVADEETARSRPGPLRAVLWPLRGCP